MEVCKFAIQGPVLFTPTVFIDDRGYFFESFNTKSYSEFISATFVQDNQSCSKKDVLRGLHLQFSPYEQGKLVRVTQGEILDVAVDIRLDSDTFGKHITIVLSEENRQELWVPPGFAHGFVSRMENTVVQYKCSNEYHKASEATLAWDDPTLAIDWEIEKPILSEKDTQGFSLDQLKRTLMEHTI